MKRSRILAALACAVLAGCIDSTPAPSTATTPPARKATPAAKPTPRKATPSATVRGYDALAIGMSYDDVLRIVGEPSQELARSEMNGAEAVVYQWSAGILGGNMSATFVNGELSAKSQIGLPK